MRGMTRHDVERKRQSWPHDALTKMYEVVVCENKAPMGRFAERRGQLSIGTVLTCRTVAEQRVCLSAKPPLSFCSLLLIFRPPQGPATLSALRSLKVRRVYRLF